MNVLFYCGNAAGNAQDHRDDNFYKENFIELQAVVIFQQGRVFDLDCFSEDE